MEKEYNHNPEENSNRLNEPAIEYHRTTVIKPSPPLTEEELADAITGEELLERVIPRIKKFFE